MDKKRGAIKKVLSRYDFSLVLLVLFLCVFGLIMVFSTSYYNANHYYSEDDMYFKRQLYFILGGFAVMIAVSMIDYHWYTKKIFGKISKIALLYFVSFGAQILVFFAGYESGGSARWLDLGGPLKFQPSELTKIMVVVTGAYIIMSMRRRLNSFWGFVICFAIISPPLLLIAMQNLSSAIIIAAMYGGMCFVVSKKKGYYLIILALATVVVILFINGEGYRSGRITEWLNIEEQQGSQILQGLYAIASGGLFGKGLGNSIQKKGYIPEVHTDMIFSIICEELGIIGGIMLIALFLILLWKIYRIAVNAPDIYGGLIATGVFIHIAVQTWIHIAVVTSTMPATGATLPFVSYGGSSLLMMMGEMGIVLSVSKYSYDELPGEEDVEDEQVQQPD